MFQILKKGSRVVVGFDVCKSVNTNLTFMRRLILLFLVVAGFPLTIFSQSVKTSVNLENAPIKTILAELEKGSEYTFIYSSSVIDTQKKLTIKHQNQTLEVILKDLCAKAGIAYSIDGKRIILTPKEASAASTGHADGKEKKAVFGLVEDEAGLPLSGAYVYLKNNNSIWTTSDKDGKYVIQLPADLSGNDALLVSYIGMKTAELPVNGRNTIDIVLQSDMTLDEVVMVAYGTAKKSNITGAISSISADKIAARPVSSVLSALSGAAPGVQILSGSGQPGEDPSIRIRGIGSYNASSDPLFVLDGVPFNGSMSSINPDDIENVSILKDAASTALYGSRGANGVILITTKRGREGKTNLNVKLTQGLSMIGLPDYEKVDAFDYMPLMWEAARNGYVSNGKTMAQASADASSAGKLGVVSKLGYNPFKGLGDGELISTDGKLNPNATLLWGDDMDWNAPIERVGHRTDVTMAASGGNNKSDFLVSVNYLNDKGWVDKSKFERFSARLNGNFKVTPWLKVGANVATSVNNSVDLNANYSLYFASMIAPIYPIHKHDRVTGDYILDNAGNLQYDYGNAIVQNGITYGNRPATVGRHGIAEHLFSSESSRRITGQSRIYAEVNLMKDLKFTANASVDAIEYLQRGFQNQFVGDGAPIGRASRIVTMDVTLNFNQLLTYNKVFGKHEISALLGHESYDYNIESLDGGKQGIIIPGNMELVNFTTINNLGGYSRTHRVEGYLTRVSYVYDNARYAVEASFRRDGSSKFEVDTRWGNFFSFGGGWRIDREKFMSGAKWVDLLKLRASFGQNGNDAGLSPYEWHTLYSFNNNAAEPGYIQAVKPGNPTLRWETQTQIDVGVEFSFLNNRIRGAVDYFKKDANDLIFGVPLSYSTGYTSQSQNVGRMNNKGVEIDLTFVPVQTKNITWDVRLNATNYKNTITELPNDQKEIRSGSFKRVEGRGMYDYFLYQWYGVNPENGDGLYLFDDSGDAAAVEARWNTVLKNKYGYELDGQRVVWRTTYAKNDWCGKKALPDLYGSLSTSFRYKNFSLGVQMNYQLGGWSLDAAWNMSMSAGKYGFGKSVEILDRWTTPGQITNVPRMDEARATNFDATASSRWFTSASYLSIKNVNLMYDFPKKIANKLTLSGLQLFLSGENLALFSARKGFDPSSSLTSGSVHGYSMARTFILGLNISFAN